MLSLDRNLITLVLLYISLSSVLCQNAPTPTLGGECTTQRCIVSWQAAVGASSYNLFHRGESTALCTTTSQFDCDVAGKLQFVCANYTLELRVSFTAGGSATSDPLYVQISAESQSSAPPAPGVTVRSASSVSVTWTAPWRTASLPLHWVDEFLITADPLYGGDTVRKTYYTTFPDESEASSFTTNVVGLQPDTIYEFTITPITCFGNGETSAGRRERTNENIVVTDPPNVFTSYVVLTYKFTDLLLDEFDDVLFKTVITMLLRLNGFETTGDQVKIIEKAETDDSGVTVKFQVQTTNLVEEDLTDELTLLPTPSCSSYLITELAAVSGTTSFDTSCILVHVDAVVSNQDALRDEDTNESTEAPAWRLPVIIGCSVGGGVLILILIIIVCQLRGTYGATKVGADEIQLSNGQDLKHASLY